VRLAGISTRQTYFSVPRRTIPCVGLSLLFMVLQQTAGAQQAQPDAYAGFEGRSIAEIELTARPLMNVDAFRSLVQLKAGERFSMAALRDSVAALQQTKEFTQVQVDIEPQPQGLQVLFILEPTDYIGLISFPGADKTFSYTQLLQAVNLQEQSPYVASQLEQSKRALLDFLAANGYFAATVDASVQIDEPHRIANFIFRVNLNRIAKIGILNFDGLSPDEANAARKVLGSVWARVRRASVKPGQKYSRQRLQKAVGYARNHLRKEGRLAPVVRLNPPTYQARTNRADINFQMEPGPMLSVRAMGARVSQRTLKRLVPIFEENEVDQDLVDEGRRNLVSYFESKGFFDATVNSQMDRQTDRVSVVYNITRGSRHRVEGVYFQGNQFADDDQLKAFTQIKKGWLFLHGTFSNDALRKSVTALTAFYKNAGFSSVAIEPQVHDYEPAVDVTFEISEGPRDLVHDMRVLDAQGAPSQAGTANRSLNLGNGMPYSPYLLEQDRNQILAAFLNDGYLNATFKSTVSPVGGDAHSLDVVYTLDRGPQAHVGEVVLLGNQRTNPGFVHTVTRTNVQEGSPISEGKFLTAEGDLYTLGIFDWASIHPLRPINTQTQEEVLIGMHESKRNTIEFGAGLEVIPRSGNIPVGTVALPGLPPIGLGNKFTASQQSFFGPRGSIQFERHNLRGRAETASIALIASRLDQRASLTYTDPHFRGSSWSSLFSASGERNTQNPIFTAQLAQASFQVEKALDAKRTQNVIFRYNFQHTDLSRITIPELLLPQDQRVRLSTLSAEYIRDTRDKPLDAHHGLYQTLDFGITPRFLGSSDNFVRVLGQTAFYRPVRPWLTWANNFRLGFAVPFAGSRIPLSERFFTGGVDSLRGFPINGAGPQRPVQVCGNPGSASTCTLISVPVGGNMLFIFNSEARFPLPLKKGLGGVLFYDGGNVYSAINLRQFADNYTNSVGIGFRYNTPVGPVRLDLGYRITSVPGVKATQYFVTLGQSF
jgi:outer membrane protein insertion porin family